jgi:hypothetical protein
VTHTIDYLVPSQLGAIANGPQFTRTTLVAINGTGTVANVATYVLGKGHVFHHAFEQIQPADEAFLLPFAHFGSDPNAPPSEWDAPDSPYVGETIVVASDVPVMVTGAVLEGFKDLFVAEDWATDGSNESRRTLDVRQFDCNLPADFAKVSLFCTHFAPVPPPGSP